MKLKIDLYSSWSKSWRGYYLKNNNKIKLIYFIVGFIVLFFDLIFLFSFNVFECGVLFCFVCYKVYLYSN